MKYLYLFLCLFPLICYSASSSVDLYAQTVPLSVQQSKQTLAEYFQKYASDEEELARLIAAFIVFNFDFNNFEKKWNRKALIKRQQPKPLETGNLFTTRIGTSRDFADLFTDLALLSGLKAVTIQGYAGPQVTQNNYHLFEHFWNAVQIDGEWKLLDVTWAMKGAKFGSLISNVTAYNAEMNRRKDLEYSLRNLIGQKKIFDDSWFLVEPYRMLKTHYPLDPKWQLLLSPRRFSFIPEE